MLEYPNVAELLLVAHPNEVPLAIPASSEVAQQLSNRCRQVERLPGEPRCRPNLAASGAVVWQLLANFGQHLTNSDYTWPTWAISRPTLTNIRPDSLNIRRIGPNLGQVRPTSAQIRPNLVDVGQLLSAMSGQGLANLGQTWPTRGPARLKLAELGPDRVSERLSGSLWTIIW